MFGQTFYHKSLRNYIIMFGNLFNDITVNRYDSNNNLNTSIKVPINYGPRDKALSRIDQNPNLIPEYGIILPRMSFEMIAMNYAPTRKLNTIDRRAKLVSDNTRLQFQYNPVPYDINMTLSIMVKNADDGAQILEQVLPYFTPEWTTTMRLVPDMDFITDIPVVLQAVSTEDTYEGSFEQRRALIHTLDFIIKGYFYGPVKTSEVIRKAQVDIGSLTSDTSFGVDLQSGKTLITPDGITNADVAATGRDSRITVTPKIGGTQATATANIHSNGVINTVTVTSGGSDYNGNAAVSFSIPATRTGAVTLIGPSAPLPRGNAGFPYSNGIATTTGGDGSGLTLDITTTNTGLISAGSINFSGSGYQVGNVLTARQPGASNSVFFVVISVATVGGADDKGEGTVVFSANGNNVTSINITEPGSGYTSAPTVTITAPPGLVATSDIDAADNFGFGITRNFYTDGKKYNPVTDSDE